MPPTKKVHHIIARTAMFVNELGLQSEIVLRVKQGDNPTFGFLMPNHHLHASFRFLVDHQELLQPDADGKLQNEKISDPEHNRTYGVEGGALSLLVSVYGTGEDEDDTAGNDPELTELGSGETLDAVGAGSFLCAYKTGTTSSTKKGDALSLLCAAVDKSQTSAPLTVSKIEPSVLEPPSDLKRLVDKIVEFILKNGKQFEALLIEQDSKHGRFPFLLPSNLYHSYYLKVLQKDQESKLSGKSILSEKDDSEREVIGKSKKDGQDSPSKATQQQFGVNVDATAAAAILQAATRGIKIPNLGILSSTSLNGHSHVHSLEGGQASSLGFCLSSQSVRIIQRSDQNGEHGVSVPVANAIKAASEVDSSEACLTGEHKLKAERLKQGKDVCSHIKKWS
ncbi:hypothetical protein F0562_008775 [Nyssa sinensis]|uniref:SURP motif domain-containing protein n=1 Tax=Nyssa sinensis TaxID=561372 RepID=A0A5J5AB83_9ASTE|nr:hypothetical protein F0562_008775 [Nyssa sinensis]